MHDADVIKFQAVGWRTIMLQLSSFCCKWLQAAALSVAGSFATGAWNDALNNTEQLNKSMSTNIHICIYVCVYIYICMYVYIYIYILCTKKCVCAHLYICKYESLIQILGSTRGNLGCF